MTLSQRAIEAAIEEYRGGGSCCAEDAMRAAIESALAVDGLCLVKRLYLQRTVDIAGRNEAAPEIEAMRALLAAANDGEERK